VVVLIITITSTASPSLNTLGLLSALHVGLVWFGLVAATAAAVFESVICFLSWLEFCCHATSWLLFCFVGFSQKPMGSTSANQKPVF